jgi:hypothetical protein
MAEGKKHRLSARALRFLFAKGILRGRGSGKNRKVEYTKGASGNGAGKADHSATRGARVAAGKAIAANADQGAITLARRLKGLTSADKAKLAARPKTLSPTRENRPDAVYSPEARARLQGARAALTGQKPDYSATRAARVAAGKAIAAKADQGAIALAKRLKGLTSSDRAKLASRPKTLSARKENRPTAVYTPEQRARLQGARQALARKARAAR